MGAEHLYAVSNDSAEQPPPGGNADRAKARPRAKLALPTDRMKFDVQVQVLKAYCIASNNGAEAVTADDIAGLMHVSAATASLNNNFFVDAGLLERVSKGAYRPTAATIDFVRELNYNRPDPGARLASNFKTMWYFDIVRGQVEMGNADRAEHIFALAKAAGASDHHQPHLENILEWLAYAKLITLDENKVAMAEQGTPTAPAATTGADDATREKADKPDPVHVDTDPDPNPTPPAPSRGATVLSLSFDVELTADDLSKLTSDQIRALYEAVGHVAAIKASLA